MLSLDSLRATAAKLVQAPKSDQKWILGQLPEDVAQSIIEQIKELENLGIENPSALLKPTDLSNVKDGTMQLVLEHSHTLSAAELFLYTELLETDEKRVFNSHVDENTREEMLRFSARRSVQVAPKFKALFIDALHKSLKG
jgi:hypothetical protein